MESTESVGDDSESPIKYRSNGAGLGRNLKVGGVVGVTIWK